MVPAIPSQGSPGTASGTEGGPGELFVYWDSLGVFSERRQTKTHLLHLVVVVCRQEKRSQRARGFQLAECKTSICGETKDGVTGSDPEPQPSCHLSLERPGGSARGMLG